MTMKNPPMRLAIEKAAIPDETEYVMFDVGPGELDDVSIRLVYSKGSSNFQVPVRFRVGGAVVFNEEWFGPK